jgi:hypothetical protein
MPEADANTQPTRAECELATSELAHENGWLHHHSRYEQLPAPGRDDGFPSEVLYRASRLLFVLFAGADEPTRRQLEWANGIRGVAHVELLIVRPPGIPLLERELRQESPAC